MGLSRKGMDRKKGHPSTAKNDANTLHSKGAWHVVPIQRDSGTFCDSQFLVSLRLSFMCHSLNIIYMLLISTPTMFYMYMHNICNVKARLNRYIPDTSWKHTKANKISL